jgi:hypothetical protein
MIDYEIQLNNKQMGQFVLPDRDEPIGWDSIAFVMKRHKKFHGVFPEVSTNLKWICSGFDYITQCYNNEGIDADIEVIIIGICNGNRYLVYHGKIDLTTATWTERYVECNIKPYNCLDLLLNRLDVKINLYDEPCFSELTYDKTAYRTRYKFAPYAIRFPEIPIIASAQFELLLDPNKTCTAAPPIINDCKYPPFPSQCQNYCFLPGAGNAITGNKDSYHTMSTFQYWDRFFGNTLFLCDSYSAFTSPPCSYSDACDNNINNPDELVKLYNGFEINIIKNDLDIFQPLDVLSLPINLGPQWIRDAGFNQTPDPENRQSPGDFTIGTAPCSCGIYEIDLDIEFSLLDSIKVDSNSEVEFIRWNHRLIFEWGGFQFILHQSGPHTFSNGCSVFTQGIYELHQESNINVTFNGTIQSCDVRAGDEMRIYMETTVGGIFEGAGIIGNAEVWATTQVFWTKANMNITTKSCIEDWPAVGDGFHDVYMVHEAFSRLVEHYTNNCLRVKTGFFCRPNSLEGGDDCEYQNPKGTGGSGSGGSPELCSELSYTNMPAAAATCTASWVPPSAVPGSCTNTDPLHSILPTQVVYDDLGFYTNGCFTITQPGTYTINYQLLLDITLGFIWTRNRCPSGVVEGKVALVYGPNQVDILNLIYGFPPNLVNAQNCDGGQVYYPGLSQVPNYSQNISNSITFTITNTDITNNDNVVCLLFFTDVLAEAGPCRCGRPPSDVGGAAIIRINEGTFTLCKGETAGSASAACFPATRECDCDNPEPFPICSETFDIEPYQCDNQNCAAWTTICSGWHLRNFGNQLFTSFNELFNAMNSIWCIGMGYTDFDPNNVYIESYRYFYNEDIVLEINDLDLYLSKYKRTVASNLYYNFVKIGYDKWLQDKYNTIDEFNSWRQYSSNIKTIDGKVDQISKYVASSYAIEFQRRQRYTVNSNWDDNIFVVCVGTSTDVNNTTTVNILNPISQVTVPNHMYEVAVGIDFASGIFYPETLYNWRIRPWKMMLNWSEWLSIGLWHRSASDEWEFAAADANFLACGQDVQTTGVCPVYYNCENDNVEKYNETAQLIFPEYIEFEYPLTVEQYWAIKNNPYGTIIVNGNRYFIEQVNFKPNANSKFKLLMAYRNKPI